TLGLFVFFLMLPCVDALSQASLSSDQAPFYLRDIFSTSRAFGLRDFLRTYSDLESLSSRLIHSESEIGFLDGWKDLFGYGELAQTRREYFEKKKNLMASVPFLVANLSRSELSLILRRFYNQGETIAPRSIYTNKDIDHAFQKTCEE